MYKHELNIINEMLIQICGFFTWDRGKIFNGLLRNNFPQYLLVCLENTLLATRIDFFTSLSVGPCHSLNSFCPVGIRLSIFQSNVITCNVGYRMGGKKYIVEQFHTSFMCFLR